MSKTDLAKDKKAPKKDSDKSQGSVKSKKRTEPTQSVAIPVVEQEPSIHQEFPN